ncbi:hypothetical protein RND81_04G036900 [Saponaria officinalis]|uniref:Endonuclease/exonuclease/phosphatase domain-containing protein n=1 Tax=Saponaria officinalis TaxID=3572 RepID=A0AAW1LKA3_SAPOF
MHDIGFWNVRGLNKENKQKSVKWFMHNNNVGLFGLLETKVNSAKVNNVISNMCDGWSVSTNCRWHSGGRIWVLWNPALFVIQFLEYSPQLIHMNVCSRTCSAQFHLTMVYVFNGVHEREDLWGALKRIADSINGPWAWAGDFNYVLSPDERLGGQSTVLEMDQFHQCVSFCGMMDITASGSLFTWNNKQIPEDRICSRLDRFMVNASWVGSLPNYTVYFHPEGIFDHTPCTVSDFHEERRGGSFKYLNMWGKNDQFLGYVQDIWDQWVDGCKMFCVVRKLKMLKPKLKELNKHCFSDIENNAGVAEKCLVAIQQRLSLAPTDLVLLMREIEASKAVKELSQARDSFLKQKAKVRWLADGDNNTAYFHQIIKGRLMKNKVLQVEDELGCLQTDSNQIQSAFLAYYKNLLGSRQKTHPVSVTVVQRGKCCTADHLSILNREITAAEVRECLFSIPSDKSPGPDGYTSGFFKDAWPVIGNEVCAAVLNFFATGKLLSQLNATIITLIPKMERPISVKHFCPISCCNILTR